MRAASMESQAIAIDRRAVLRATRRIGHAIVDEMLTLAMLTGIAALLFLEFT